MDQADAVFALDEPDPSWVSVAGLQCQLRDLFATRPPFRAVAGALEAIATLLDAEYAVVHACVAARPLSEEWSRPDFALRASLRDHVNEAMMGVLEADEPRCKRIGGGTENIDYAVTAAVLYDSNAEPVGSMALVFKDTGRAHAYEMLVQLEAIAGFLALLLAQPSGPGSVSAGSVTQPLDCVDGSNPLRLLLQVATDLASQHDLDQVAVGVVDGANVRVALVNNELDLRPSNPGVRCIREAMSECLDLGDPVRFDGAGDKPGYRLHAAWRRERDAGVVASLPISVEGKTVAIVSMATVRAASLDEAALQSIAKEVEPYALLLPVTRLATRSLRIHTWDSLRGVAQALRKRGRRAVLLAALAVTLVSWLAFGTLNYQLTVPCTVAALDPRVVSCPRDGILSDLFAKPGDIVRKGQLLALLDSHDDELRRAELDAEQLAIEAQIDVALSEYDSGGLRVLEAQRNGVRSKIAVVSRRIEHARVRAPIDGIVLAGELREQLGARIAMGEPLFEVTRYDGGRVKMRIPEQHVIAAREATQQTFLALARPDDEFVLRDFQLAPASSVMDGKNVFVAEARIDESVDGLPPGIEGFAILDIGPRPALWVMSHRVVDWLRLNFWL